MKLSFEPNLQYQQDAIKSVTALFEGQPMEDSIEEFKLEEKGKLDLINGIGNKLVLSVEQVLENLQEIQTVNEISKAEKLDGFIFR